MKHKAPDMDMPMNMTPMIDVVFNLIIFFMVITDMSQQDLEDLQLPQAIYAVPDKPKKDEWRPVVNIPIGGPMVVKGETYYDPEKDDALPDPYKRVKEWLGTVAYRMKKKGLNPDAPISSSNPEIPDEAILVRADESTPFKHVQKFMELCGYKGIMIWKIQLGVAENKEKKAADAAAAAAAGQN